MPGVFFQRHVRLIANNAAAALCQNFRIAAGTFGGTEARHGHRQNVLTISAQHIKCPKGNQQRQRAVQTAGQADHRRLCPGVSQAALQAQCGNGQNFLADLLLFLHIRKNFVQYFKVNVKKTIIPTKRKEKLWLW